MKNQKQAPKGKWRYGCVKRTYVTKLKDTDGNIKKYQETNYELAEVYDRGRSWTLDQVSPYSNSKAGLIKTLKNIISDLEKYETIAEREPTVRKLY